MVGEKCFKVALSKAARQIVLFWGFLKGKYNWILILKGDTVVALASTDGKLDLPNCYKEQRQIQALWSLV